MNLARKYRYDDGNMDIKKSKIVPITNELNPSINGLVNISD